MLKLLKRWRSQHQERQARRGQIIEHQRRLLELQRRAHNRRFDRVASGRERLTTF